VTGGGTGIGAAIARALAAEGAKLTLVGRRRDKLEAVGARLAGALAAPADVTDRAAVDAAFDLARRTNGPITILVNNAGAAAGGPFQRVSPEEWQAAIAVNLDALFHCCQAALPDLIGAEAGRIVTIASTAGLQGFAYTAPYVAAKHGAVGLTRALAAEFSGTRLTANAICPGFTETELVAEAIAKIRARTGRSEAEARNALAQMNSSGRLIAPEEIAQAVIGLCLSARNGEAVEIA
jgi:NAD(P)-dependent dehydrogenase (short-subunit alcohol dehydrogenase family)